MIDSKAFGVLFNMPIKLAFDPGDSFPQIFFFEFLVLVVRLRSDPLQVNALFLNPSLEVLARILSMGYEVQSAHNSLKNALSAHQNFIDVHLILVQVQKLKNGLMNSGLRLLRIAWSIEESLLKICDNSRKVVDFVQISLQNGQMVQHGLFTTLVAPRLGSLVNDNFELLTLETEMVLQHQIHQQALPLQVTIANLMIIERKVQFLGL